jgi:hypothetical protein
VDALGSGHYRRYDESTATRLGDAAERLTRDWDGDLRRLRDAGDGAADRIAGLVTGFPGIGPAGASIFLREVQQAWPSVMPYVDTKMTDGARLSGLPADPGSLAALLAGCGQPVRLSAALVRVALSHRPADELLAGTGKR